jgi:hypothetical protein
LATYENRDAGIYLANELTGECKQIPAPPYQVLNGVACSAKAGMPLLLTETSDKYTLWIMKPGGTEQRKLLDREKKISSPRWSQIGDSVSYFRMEGNTIRQRGREVIRCMIMQNFDPSVGQTKQPPK